MGHFIEDKKGLLPVLWFIILEKLTLTQELTLFLFSASIYPEEADPNNNHQAR